MVGSTATLTLKFISDMTSFSTEPATREMMQLKAATEAVNVASSALVTTLNAGVLSGAALGVPFIIGSNAAADFQKNVKLAVTVADDPAVKNGYSELIAQANDLAVQYGVSATEISESILEMSKTGYDMSTMFSILEPSLKLSTAEFMDMSEATSIANQMWNVFNTDGLYSGQEMLNEVYKAASLTRLEVADMPDILAQSASSFSLVGASMEEYLATSAALSNINVDMGSNFSTLTAILIREKDAINAWLGQEIVKDGKVAWTAFMDAIAEESKNADFSDTVVDLFTSKSYKAVAQLAMVGDTYNTVLGGLANGTDLLSDASDSALDTIQGMMNVLKESIMTVVTSEEVMDAMQSALSNLVTLIQSSDVKNMLADVFLISSEFVSNHGQSIVDLLEQILVLYERSAPAMVLFSNLAIGILDVMTQLPPEILLTGLFLAKLTKTIQITSWATAGLAGSIGGVFLGMTMIIGASNDIEMALGIITTAVMGAMSAILLLRAIVGDATVFKDLGLGLLGVTAAVGSVAAVGGALAISGWNNEPDYGGSYSSSTTTYSSSDYSTNESTTYVFTDPYSELGSGTENGWVQ